VVLVAVPTFRAGPLGRLLGADAGRVAWADMGEVGGNPARVIPALAGFARDHAGARVSVVGECAWPGRTGPKIASSDKRSRPPPAGQSSGHGGVARGVLLAGLRGLGAGRGIIVDWGWTGLIVQRILLVAEQQVGQDGEEPGEDEPGV
jgi:hypothetical protein